MQTEPISKINNEQKDSLGLTLIMKIIMEHQKLTRVMLYVQCNGLLYRRMWEFLVPSSIWNFEYKNTWIIHSLMPTFILQNRTGRKAKVLLIFPLNFLLFQLWVRWGIYSPSQSAPTILVYQVGPRRGVTEEVPAVGFCLGSGLFGSYNSN